MRYYQVSVAALGPRFPQGLLLAFGIASLLLAALYLFNQGDIKRLLAYSSVEHMGILAIGVSFGAPVAFAGVLLHVLAHAAAKGNAFMGAGVLVRKYRTKLIADVNGGLDLLPWSGPLLLATVLALCAMPPFGIFRSEFLIVAGGFATSKNAAAAVLIIAGGEPGAAPVPHLGYTSDVLELVEEFLHRPLARPMMALVRTVKRLQSGRLGAYLAYMLISGPLTQSISRPRAYSHRN